MDYRRNETSGFAMLDRRQAIMRGAAAVALASICGPHAFAKAPAETFSALLDSFMDANLDASPEVAAALGLDTGGRSWERSKLDDRSLGAIRREKARLADQLQRLLAFDRASLEPKDQINYDVVLFCLREVDGANRRFDYGPGASLAPYVSAGAPYIVSPLTGAYSAIPAFLSNQHPIRSKSDADAYLSRLTAFAKAMDQEIEVVRHDVARGCAPPDFALDKTIEQMAKLRDAPPQDSGLVTSVSRRAREIGIPGNYFEAATAIVRGQVYPALERQIELMREVRWQATHDAGVWKFPNGDQYYANSLIAWTSARVDPVEMHKIGLAAVAEYQASIDQIMKRQGMSGGAVATRLRAMFDDPRFRYPNTDAGKDQLINDLNAKVRAVRAKLPQYFSMLPQADLIVQRIPKYMEAARPSGYYQPPSLDNQRPGVFFINLRDTAETPSWILPARTFHQSIPGHHLKFSTYQEANLPLIRKIDFYSAYMEGWSAYAAQLADEMGMYDDDPFGRIGYLQSALRASVGLVVDTGIHAHRWSREKAIAYFMETLGEPAVSASTEIERYCIWPGQVCSYMLDKQRIIGLRDEAKAALGRGFDMRQFHDVILQCGAVPHHVIETVVNSYIQSAGQKT